MKGLCTRICLRPLWQAAFMSEALLHQLRIELSIKLAPNVGATTKHRWVQTTVHVIPSCRSLNRRFGAQWTHTGVACGFVTGHGGINFSVQGGLRGTNQITMYADTQNFTANSLESSCLRAAGFFVILACTQIGQLGSAGK